MNSNEKAEVGVVFVRKNEKNVEYLAFKIDINGEIMYFKAFLNSGWDEKEHNERPKYMVFKSLNKPYANLNDRSLKLD